MRKSAVFPDPSRSFLGLLLINSANLSSALCDGEHLTRLFVDHLKASSVVIVVDCESASQNIKRMLTSKIPQLITKVSFLVCTNPEELLLHTRRFLNTLPSNCDSIISISSHGHASGSKNYIVFKGKQITDVDFHAAILESAQLDSRVLVLSDCCQSGTFLNMRYDSSDPLIQTHRVENESTTDQLLSKTNVVCIGAVGDSEFDMDDLSDMGYDGGLSSAVIDYYLHSIPPTIGGLFEYYCKRVGPTGKHPIIAFNDNAF